MGFAKSFLKAFVFLSLVGFVSTMADLHAEEYGPKAHAEQCCVACCPAHHLAPLPEIASVEAITLPLGRLISAVSCVSIDPLDSFFRPPRALLSA